MAKNTISVFNIIKEGIYFMSMFGDYKAYKHYEPAYASWKQSRDIMEAKRLEYLKQHPEEFNPEDVQRGKTLLRAIDIMDEYSQKRAQDMEIAANTGAETAIMLTELAGISLGLASSKLKTVQNLMNKIAKKFKFNKGFAETIIPMIAGMTAGIVASFPVQAWAAKAQVSASRKGRFEAMRKDLNSPNGFAILTPEQTLIAEKRMQSLPQEDINATKKIKSKLANGFNSWKDMAIDSKEYKAQRKQFEAQLTEIQAHLNDKMTPAEIENAKKDQQLLTKLVEKIDIASQDYAENTELAVGILTTAMLTGGYLVGAIVKKILSLFKVKSADKAGKITQIVSLLASVIASGLGSYAAKDASRVGRFKIKQELAKNPETLVYIDDNQLKNIENINIKQSKKGMFAFLKEAWKNQKEYQKYKETTAPIEKRFYQAVETLKLSPEQLRDAKRLQKNTFMTFNKVDEKSQKYSENVEALGQSVGYMLSSICVLASMGLMFLLSKKSKNNSKLESILNGAGASIISFLPAVAFNIYLTKEQKKASRVADMLAINELSDYRQFR